MFSYERAEVAVGCLTAHLETSWWCFLAQLSAQTVQPSSNPENLQRTMVRMSKPEGSYLFSTKPKDPKMNEKACIDDYQPSHQNSFQVLKQKVVTSN